MLKFVSLLLWAMSVVANEARLPSYEDLLEEYPPSVRLPPTLHPPSHYRSPPPPLQYGRPPSPPPPLHHYTPPPTPPPPLGASREPPTSSGAMPLLPQGECEDSEGGGEDDYDSADDDEGWCPSRHDGLICWPATPRGTYASMPCPPIFATHNTSFASMYCGLTGVWNQESVDYRSCADDVTILRDSATGDVNRSREEEESRASLMESVIATRYQNCVNLMRNVPPPDDGRVFCPRTFDGWSCWNDTMAGDTAYSPCPYFITGFDHKRLAHKVCNEDGTWFRHPDNNRTWSNYTTCIDLDDLMMRQLINTIYIAGYSVSLIALVISLVIFCYFRTLQCTRIRLHKNLFVSFILNNSLWIIWYLEVADKPETVLNNNTGCQALHILLHYFLVASYYWMFSEGLYLHTLLVIAFVTEERLMRWFYLLGWGAPAVIVSVYAAVRGSSTSDTQHCWIDESHYKLILSTPVCVSILANLVFLINIVRVLVTKLRANNVPADNSSTRKAVRATLILIPLLGLHYVLMPFRPAPGSNGELVYQVVAALASSFQGFCVALLFCFCNGEVALAVKKKWNQYQFIHDRRRFSLSTACALSVNGIHGKSLQDLRKLSPFRATNLPLPEQQETAGGTGNAERKSPLCYGVLVVENPTVVVETRLETSEDESNGDVGPLGNEVGASLRFEGETVGVGDTMRTDDGLKWGARDEALGDVGTRQAEGICRAPATGIADYDSIKEQRGECQDENYDKIMLEKCGGELNSVGGLLESPPGLLELQPVTATVHQTQSSQVCINQV